MTVLNQFEQGSIQIDGLEKELQDLILDIAHSIRDKMPIRAEIIHRANLLFKEYNPLHLKVGMISEDNDVGSVDKQREGFENQLLLHTEFIDEPHYLKRVYMEGLISIFEALEKGDLELQQCILCDNWFIPYKRAQVAKFCSSKCRNRYNYLMANNKHKGVQV
ncbi:hypothetical protein [Caldalkalibacillus mannanilyticus]|uniref:hypothetical protein n=1 Tax=Caldalkalibacillus mannanilyticus TaxID=1418 RepID=UPI0011DDF722|nr:hypothetical protein [Caldalkalibacillus mannanilyticus]